MVPLDDDIIDGDTDGDGSDRWIGIKGNQILDWCVLLWWELKQWSPNDIKGEVWFNELRLADMDNKKVAWANIDTNFADFATVSMSGKRAP
jgi:cell surface protein SprA